MATAAPRIPLDVTFSDQLKLIGADLASPMAQPGGQSEITLYWQALKPIEKDYSTFVHLLDANDIVVAQRDMYPGQGLWPTSQISRETSCQPLRVEHSGDGLHPRRIEMGSRRIRLRRAAAFAGIERRR
jgi:hypothetical protein